jgi:hypothetical protein
MGEYLHSSQPAHRYPEFTKDAQTTTEKPELRESDLQPERE